MNPSICCSVSLSGVAGTCAGALVGKLAKMTAIAAIVRRSIWYMAEPPRLRDRYSYGALSVKFGPAYSAVVQFSIDCGQNSTVCRHTEIIFIGGGQVIVHERPEN